MADSLSRMKFLTAPLPEDFENDVWDADYCVCYSADGSKLLDAEVFPEEVVVREGCRIICDEAFAFQPYMAESWRIGQEPLEEERISDLAKISLPGSVTHIGEGAFRECGMIRSLKFPKSLVYIGPEAFQDCFSLRKAILPEGLQVIGAHAFFCCDDLEKVRIPGSIQFIGSGAFNGCDSLREIEVPRGARDAVKAHLPGRLHKLIKER